MSLSCLISHNTSQAAYLGMASQLPHASDKHLQEAMLTRTHPTKGTTAEAADLR